MFNKQIYTRHTKPNTHKKTKFLMKQNKNLYETKTKQTNKTKQHTQHKNIK